MTENQRMVAEEIIELHKTNGRFRFVYKESLQEFLKENYGIKTKSKSEAEAKAYELLNPDTLQFFAENLERFGISQEDAAKCLGVSGHMMKKLISENKIRVIGSYVFHYYRRCEYNIINVLDVINIAESIKNKKKKSEVQSIPCTKDNLAEALYVINKSAKKSRDTKQKSFCKSKHGVCHSAKTRSRNLYHLKDVALKKMCQDGFAEYMGIHRQIIEDRREPVLLDLYAIGRFTFHCPHYGEVNEKEIREEVIDGKISAEQTKEVSIKFGQAVKLLERYCGVSATGTYNKTEYGY